MTILFGVSRECTDEIREAAASVMFAAGWFSELPELLFARTILADKFGSDFTEAAKDGTGIVDPMVLDSIYYPFISRVNDLYLERWRNGELTKLGLAVGVEVVQ
jgi:hypothetical protein